MRSTPSEVACARAASLTDWFCATVTLVGWIQLPEVPRYQAMEPAFMTTRASVDCSLTTTLRVSGNCRSKLTDPTQGSFLRLASMALPSKLSSVAPSGTSRRFLMSDSVTCSVGSQTTFWMAKADELLSTKYATTSTTASTATPPTTPTTALALCPLW